jgi:hypothetical protein
MIVHYSAISLKQLEQISFYCHLTVFSLICLPAQLHVILVYYNLSIEWTKKGRADKLTSIPRQIVGVVYYP